MSLLILHNVSFDYVIRAGAVHAVREATARFEKGTFYAIVGRSGSGKSTLLSLMAGLAAPKSGEVLYNGENLEKTDCDRYRREQVGIIFQNYYLLPQLTARENIELSMELSGMKGDRHVRAEALLTEVGLTAFHGKKRACCLSGGEQQRIAVARALASDPSLILADEPTGNLDNENSKNIVALLKKAAHEMGKCVIVITHAAEVAAEADTVLCMNDGILEEK